MVKSVYETVTKCGQLNSASRSLTADTQNRPGITALQAV